MYTKVCKFSRLRGAISLLVSNKFTFETDNFTNLLVKALDLFSKVDGFSLSCLYKKKVEKTVERSIDLN